MSFHLFSKKKTNKKWARTSSKKWKIVYAFQHKYSIYLWENEFRSIAIFNTFSPASFSLGCLFSFLKWCDDIDQWENSNEKKQVFFLDKDSFGGFFLQTSFNDENSWNTLNVIRRRPPEIYDVFFFVKFKFKENGIFLAGSPIWIMKNGIVNYIFRLQNPTQNHRNPIRSSDRWRVRRRRRRRVDADLVVVAKKNKLILFKFNSIQFPFYWFHLLEW